MYSSSDTLSDEFQIACKVIEVFEQYTNRYKSYGEV